MPNRLYCYLRRKIICSLGYHEWIEHKSYELYQGGVYMGVRCMWCHKLLDNRHSFNWSDFLFVAGILALFGYLVCHLILAFLR